ncbi:AIR synthase-related protein [Niabella sp. W65]|nr:AIR synthase-related protein [Niabella sp. W65]MCH7368958.1 AIR synthase-related protein [Niabella sp. W65]
MRKRRPGRGLHRLTFFGKRKENLPGKPRRTTRPGGETYVVGRLLKPEARKDIIEFFAEQEILPTAMMDVSDGLSSEILHICKQSNLGCVLYEDKIPIAEESRLAAFKFEIDPTTCALSGGEDYELLFTVSQSDYEKVSANANISIIGYMTEVSEGSTIITKGGGRHAITAQGWNPLK